MHGGREERGVLYDMPRRLKRLCESGQDISRHRTHEHLGLVGLKGALASQPNPGRSRFREIRFEAPDFPINHRGEHGVGRRRERQNVMHRAKSAHHQCHSCTLEVQLRQRSNELGRRLLGRLEAGERFRVP